MAFEKPASGWTAASIVPHPDKFAAAHNVISGAAGHYTPAAPVAAPVVSPAYQQLRQNLLGIPANTQTVGQAKAQSLMQSQLQPAPSQAVEEVSKQLKEQPWVEPKPSGFLNPTTGAVAKTPTSTSGWVPGNPLSTI